MKINVVKLCDTPGCREEVHSEGASLCIDCAVDEEYEDRADYWSMMPDEYFDYKRREMEEIPERYSVRVKFPKRYTF